MFLNVIIVTVRQNHTHARKCKKYCVYIRPFIRLCCRKWYPIQKIGFLTSFLFSYIFQCQSQTYARLCWKEPRTTNYFCHLFMICLIYNITIYSINYSIPLAFFSLWGIRFNWNKCNAQPYSFVDLVVSFILLVTIPMSFVH